MRHNSGVCGRLWHGGEHRVYVRRRLHARLCIEHRGRHGRPLCLHRVRQRLLQACVGQWSLLNVRRTLLRIELLVHLVHDDDQPRLHGLRNGLLRHRLHNVRRVCGIRERVGHGGERRLRLRGRLHARRGDEHGGRIGHAAHLHSLRGQLLQDDLRQCVMHCLHCVCGGHELCDVGMHDNLEPRVLNVHGRLLWQLLRGCSMHC